MAENLRMGNEEEEMLHCEGDSDYNNRFRGRGGVGEMDMEGPSIEFGDRTPLVTTLTLPKFFKKSASRLKILLT